MDYVERIQAWLLAGLLALALAIPQFASAQGSFKRIVVFGTSLSDPGNAFVLYGGTNTPPNYQVDDFLVPPPAAPYAKGGHHFSNGATWVEQFARALRLAPNAQAALRGSGTGASNYAVGGARARADDPDHNFNLARQIQAFLSANSGVAPSEALYIIEMGGNDFKDALFNPGDATILPQAIGSIIDGILTLYGARAADGSGGATKFVVWNVPNIGITPALHSPLLPPGTAENVSLFSQFVLNPQFNAALASLGGLPGIQIERYDVNLTLARVLDPASGVGITNTTAACIKRDPPFECQHPDQYLFWDGIHPTTAAHAIIAQEVTDLVRQKF